MSSNARTVPAVAVVRDTPELVTLAIPGRDATREALRDGRKIAAKVAHTLVGGAQNPRNATHEGRQVTLVDYSPVRRSVKLTPEGDAPASPDGDVVDQLIANLRALSPDALGRIVTALTGDAPAPVKREREIPPVIAARIAASHAITCRTCRDHGVVRGVGSDAGKPYRTANGAAAATTAGRSVKCPSHKRATARKSA